jgi:NhaA family Na+:H+ antiporter
LLVATIGALVWANWPAGASYSTFWATEVRIGLGGWELAGSLKHWVNDALMTLFFFVVGLEIKRELVAGELNEARKAALPVIAAVGGMILPALLYFALNTSGPASAGWGIPMATDIAFAVGVLALLGPRVPSGLRVFLLSLAIVDDIGAISVIAIFYSSDLALLWAVAAAAGLGVVAALRRARVLWVPFYAVLGVFVWYFTFRSGLHATIAGVALGLMTPARPTDPSGFDDVLREAKYLPQQPDAESLRAVRLQGSEVVSVAERLAHLLHPWTSFVVIPLFALANAGLRLDASSLGRLWGSPVALGVVIGLVLGKLAGISIASLLAIKLGAARLPNGVTFAHLLGAAGIAGIGFTVSLFIAELAFSGPALVEEAKLGVFAGSLVAGTTGVAILSRGRTV